MINQSKGTTEKSWVITYDCASGMFGYPPSLNEFFSAAFDTRPLWTIMSEDGLADSETAEQFQSMVDISSVAKEPEVRFAELCLNVKGQKRNWFRVGFVSAIPGHSVSIILTDIQGEMATLQRLQQKAEYDDLTGLLNCNAFGSRVEEVIKADPEGVADGEYAMVYFDVLRFKAINEMFGMEEGDRLLRYIAETVRRAVKKTDIICRVGSDRYIYFTHSKGEELERQLDIFFTLLGQYDLLFEITCNVGVYVTESTAVSVNTMMDRAILAQSTIKGSYTERYNFYTESLRFNLLGEQEIAGFMAEALAEKQFVVYYQPQYDHSTGGLLGAEALVRWLHPDRGMISPGVFIPIFEKNGFITKLDLYVFKQVCLFLRKCRERGMPMVPISVNFSRYDIFQPDFVEQLEAIRKVNDVPVKYLRVELTESAIIGGSQHVNEVVKKLRRFGYVVEMDDFGSGYSSLNVLRELELDLIKLDMLFLSEKSEDNRGGTIISSIVRMAKWLNLPVIAEGVETMKQADFLRSIGCNYIQGYLYSKPLPEKEYEAVLKLSKTEEILLKDNSFDVKNTYDFWDPKSLETLIFSNYVGGAAIFEYYDGKVEILRVNQKYLKELGLGITEREVIEADPLQALDEHNRKIYGNMLRRAIETGEEQEGDTWRKVVSKCCGEGMICVRSNIRLLGKNGEVYLFYGMIRNVTAEKEYFKWLTDNEKRFKAASEHAKIYYWEYSVATKEMRPCFRCMRDFGLPAVLTNYPESAIERGIFPPEVADLYREWHRQIDNGVPEIEGILPLTEARVLHKVSYTTEFDENGRPVKAYGSATPV